MPDLTPDLAELELHPDFGRWIDGDLTDAEYADSLAGRVDAAVAGDSRYTGRGNFRRCAVKPCKRKAIVGSLCAIHAALRAEASS